jgi:ABC-2 type transport system ATP-binding protein
LKPGDPSLLEAREIELGYGGTPVVRDLSLEIERGSFIGLMGANGAGKTTLLLGLSGQYAPSTGEVHFEGNSIYGHASAGRRANEAQNRAYKERISFVHENPFLYPYLAADEFLYFIARVKRLEPDRAQDQIDSLLGTLDLSPHRHKPTANLSTGMRKKLALAAAMLGTPDLLFLDEALNGVDLESAYAIKNLLRDFVARGGTVILSTHVLEVLEKLADRYLLMRDGKIAVDLDAQTLRAEAGESSLEDYVLARLRG